LFHRDSPSPANDGLHLVYSGSVGGRYILDRVGGFVAVASQKADRVCLTVLTRAERDLVSGMLTGGGLPESMWSMESVPYRSMPNRLARAQAGLFFLARGISEHGCSPTKVGEYWAMGLPVITTPNVSDTDEIIERERVGVIVHGHSNADYERAVDELLVLLKDPDLGRRCRRAAEGHYALDPACERQYALYSQLT
jgi:glycosyltransferase involved in cell wall biosynthesis